ncbi:DUF6545 domain-containing protein [Streptomyces chryseus]
MSEETANVVYMMVVVIAGTTTVAKIIAWRRERSPALRLLATCSGVGVTAFFLASPVVYRAIGNFTGVPNLAELWVFMAILAFFAQTHLMSLVWNPKAAEQEAAPGRPAVRWPLTVYTLVTLTMTTGFLLADTGDEPHPLDFNIAYGQDPGALVMLAAFQLALAYASVATAVQFRRNAKVLSTHGDPVLSRALRHISIATWFIFGYVACVGPATIAGAFGVTSLHWLHSLGPVSGSIGSLIINWGFSGAAIAAWRADRRDYRTLAALWQLVQQADPDVALDKPNQFSDLGLIHVRDFHLFSRMADILGAARSVYPWIHREPAERMAKAGRAAQWSEEDIQAAAAAAVLLDAVERKRTGQPPAAPGDLGELPGSELAVGAARGHLVKVAKYLTHPLVLQSSGSHRPAETQAPAS